MFIDVLSCLLSVRISFYELSVYVDLQILDKAGFVGGQQWVLLSVGSLEATQV